MVTPAPTNASLPHIPTLCGQLAGVGSSLFRPRSFLMRC